MKSLIMKLYTGMFRCEDCESEFSLFRVKSLICLECFGRLFEVHDEMIIPEDDSDRRFRKEMECGEEPK